MEDNINLTNRRIQSEKTVRFMFSMKPSVREVLDRLTIKSGYTSASAYLEQLIMREAGRNEKDQVKSSQE